MKKRRDDKKPYEAPRTLKTVILVESSMCVVASGPKATLKRETKVVEVKEYASIENDVTFD